MRNEIKKDKRSGVYNLSHDKFEYFKKSNRNDEYNDFLKNKSVIIVGPSNHLFSKEQKDFIDGFDVVVRVNKSFPVKENQIKFIGERTDIFYHCLEQSEENCGRINYDEVEKQNVWISTPYPKNMMPFHSDYIRFEHEIRNGNRKIKINYIDIDFYDDFMKALGTRPNTGISAIADLMSYDIKSLYICGFTFFETGFYDGYRDVPGMEKSANGTKWTKYDINFNNNHIQSLQKDFVKMLFVNDERLDGEEKLKEILGV